MNMPHRYDLYDSPQGQILLAASDAGIAGVYFQGQKYFPKDDSQWCRDGKNEYLRQAKRELAEYFAGRRKRFDVALDPAGNAYVTWTFDGPGYCVLQAGAQETVLTRLAGYATAVLARFSQDGDVDWLRRIGDVESTELSLEHNRLSVTLRGLREVAGQTTVTPTFETPDGLFLGPTMDPDSDRITARYDLKGSLIAVEGPTSAGE